MNETSLVREPDYWHRWFMGLAHHVATASKDPSTRVGAVIVDEDRIVKGMGYNGFARGVVDDLSRYADRALKYKLVVHAEANAILNANGSLRGCYLYCTHHPCTSCASLIIQAGIHTVIYEPSTPEFAKRWADDIKLVNEIFREAGVLLLELGSDKYKFLTVGDLT